MSLLLIISVICVYWPVKGYDFVSFDDFQYVVENPHVKSGISWDGYAWSVSSIYMANWHPVTWLSHMVDVHLFGMNAGAHHMINLFIHILNSLLVFFLLDRLTNDSWKSIIVAALFALHPLHVESVAWISERKDLLCSFFWMVAIIFYCGYVKNKSIYQYFMALLSFMFGLLSKPMIITLPLTLLLLDFWPLRRVNFKGGLIKDGTFNFPQTHLGSLLLEKLPFFIFSAASGLVAIYSQKYGEIT